MLKMPTNHKVCTEQSLHSCRCGVDHKTGEVLHDDSLIKADSPLDRSDAAFKSVKRSNPAYDQSEDNADDKEPPTVDNAAKGTHVKSLVETDSL